MRPPPFYHPPGVSLVYIVRKGKNPGGPIKIGFTNNMARRYWELQHESEEMLKFLAVIVPGSMALERALHHSFKEWALGHEWFQAPSSEDQARWEGYWVKAHNDAVFQASLVAKAESGTLSINDVE